MVTRTSIESDLPIPPGATLQQELEARGMTQKDLAARMGRPPQVISGICRGKKAITPETALELEKVLAVPAHIWLGLETEYQLTIARRLQRPGRAVPGFRPAIAAARPATRIAHGRKPR
jgi:HTH-type transcriptional regulator/antitoxin HigA